mmetsp:Transcript_11688/g.22240  ORF Transcript_11688/g.22240 Transcript_11688/m.22240 type:complete len:81 (-) Transcript_11688:692-934(-)
MQPGSRHDMQGSPYSTLGCGLRRCIVFARGFRHTVPTLSQLAGERNSVALGVVGAPTRDVSWLALETLCSTQASTRQAQR